VVIIKKTVMEENLHNRDYLKQRRRELRNKSTLAEVTLWKQLKNGQTGRKFRRQHSIENYIVDFYCTEEKLIIELDGEPHNNLGIVSRDGDRTERLTKLGYKIIRFENNTVVNNSLNVIEEIKRHFRNN
jgi:very-short-patch-repair endonuclease